MTPDPRANSLDSNGAAPKPSAHAAVPAPPREEPLRLAPDDDDDSPSSLRVRSTFTPASPHTHSPNPPEPRAVMADTHLDEPLVMDSRGSPGEALRWALDAMQSPSLAAADWLARDIDPNVNTAAELLGNPAITMAQVRQAKTVFKTMRIVGEKSADRRVGARLYAAAIAAGLARHGKKITVQSDAALHRAFKALLDDRRMPLPLRDLAGMALCALEQRTRGNGNSDSEDEDHP